MATQKKIGRQHDRTKIFLNSCRSQRCEKVKLRKSGQYFENAVSIQIYILLLKLYIKRFSVYPTIRL